jgi:hypothetical protein
MGAGIAIIAALHDMQRERPGNTSVACGAWKILLSGDEENAAIMSFTSGLN